MTGELLLLKADWFLLFADAIEDLAEASQPFEELDPDAYIAALRQMNHLIGVFPDACVGAVEA